VIAWYDQERRTYREVKVEEPVEVTSLIGNLTIREGRPFVHVHVVLGDSSCRSYAGHLISARVFMLELLVIELPPLERAYDEVLGIWALKA